MTTIRSVVAAGLIGIAVTAGAILMQSSQRRSGTDSIPAESFVEPLSHASELCQQEQLPADTAGLRLKIDTHGMPGGRLDVSFTGASGKALSDGVLTPGWSQGIVRIPLAHVSQTSEARFCIRNNGPSAIHLAGAYDQPGTSLQIDGRTVENQRVRVEYLRPGRESWLSLLPAIVHRFSFGRAFFMRAWAWLAALLLIAVAVAGAVYLLVRDGA